MTCGDTMFQKDTSVMQNKDNLKNLVNRTTFLQDVCSVQLLYLLLSCVVLCRLISCFIVTQANEMPKLTEQLAAPLRQMQVTCLGRKTHSKFFTIHARYRKQYLQNNA